jgi:transposase
MEILGRERRRRWTEAERLEIVAAVGVNGETLSRVARRYEVSRAQIYNWRHTFKTRGQLPASSGAIFLPVDIAPSLPQAAAPFEEPISAPSVVELCLARGRRLRFDSGIESATLMRLIRSVEGA